MHDIDIIRAFIEDAAVPDDYRTGPIEADALAALERLALGPGHRWDDVLRDGVEPPTVLFGCWPIGYGVG